MKFDKAPEISDGGSKTFLKLKNGDSVKGVFRGDVYEFFCKWDGQKSVACAETDEKARFRFRINFVMKENGAFTSKIWEQGAVVYNQLKDLHSEYDLTKTLVTIKRSGSDLTTTYSILPVKDGHVTPELERNLSDIRLQELGQKGNTHETQTFENFDEVPF